MIVYLSALAIAEKGVVDHFLLYITDNKNGTKNAQAARDLYLKDKAIGKIERFEVKRSPLARKKTSARLVFFLVDD